MKLLLTTDTLGGVWTCSVDLARELSARGHEVVMAALGKPTTPVQRSEVADIDRLELREWSGRLEWMSNSDDDVRRSGDWLLALCDETRPDLVHLNGYAHGGLPWERPVVIGAHSCVGTWFDAVHGTRPGPEWDGYLHRLREGIAAASCVVMPTLAYLRHFERVHGVQPHARVIHNGRRQIDPAAPVRRSPLVFAAGRLWDEAKNIELLTSAAHELRWPVAVAGNTRSPEGHRPNLDHVRSLGQLSASEVAEWYARSSIFVLAARYEPFGLTALEAGQAGCALVLSDIPTLKEIWGDAAWYIDPDDREELIRAVNLLGRQPDIRALYASAAWVRSRTFTAARMADEYLKLYEHLLGIPIPTSPLQDHLP